MRQSVERYLGALEAGDEFSSNTVSAYRNDLNQFVLFLDDDLKLQNWAEVQDSHLVSYILRLREREYASSTIARKTAAVRSFFGFMVRNGELRLDPAESMASPRVEKYVPKAMTEEEIRALLRQPSNESTAEAARDSAMLHTLYATGMRVSELVALNLDDVDLERSCVCCTGKQGRRREIELTAEAVSIVRAYVETGRTVIVRNPDEPALFVNHRGTRLTRQGFWLILKDHAVAAGIENITPHTLRHSFAAHQVTRGRELGDIQRILGHVSISTTQIYQRIADELQQIDAHANGASEDIVAFTVDAPEREPALAAARSDR
jgi:integrase/recombinase XerD